MIRIQLNRKWAKINLAFFLIIYFLTRVIELPIIIANLLIGLSGIMAYMFCVLYRKYIQFYNPTLLAIVLSCLFFLSFLYNGNANIVGLLWIWCYIGIALLLYNFYIDYVIITFIYYSVILFFGIKCALGIVSDNVMAMGSRNTISAVVLLYMIIFYLVGYIQQRTVKLLPGILAIVICFWAMGRAGILASCFFLITVSFYIVAKKGKKIIKRIFIISLLYSTSYYVITTFFGEVITRALTRFQEKGFQDVRTIIFAEYMGELTKGGNLFFGVPFSEGRLLSHFRNPHNSWIMLHAEFGLIAFSSIIFVLLLFFVKCLIKKEYFLCILFLTAFVRSCFDWLSFPGSFDVLWWFFMIMCFDKKKLMGMGTNNERI